ncbi:MAG: amidase [Myxococcota bacterium]|jgi:amidase|nr:amidase [Myxococcota bacterium]
MDTDVCDLTAVELASLMARRELSARELLDAHLARIERVNPQLNAIVTLVPERARSWAQSADDAQARGERLGRLHGLPVAHKDAVMTKGIRSTMGSPLLAENVPTHDDLVVTRLRAAGAITIGKTNMPEFGAGSHTFNPVFGPTRNPYDLTRSCGGSSGGAAVALATGMVPIADGSDMGGSLRNPGNFNNVVGFRPSPGRVPIVPTVSGWESLTVLGPMARTVEDAALLLSAMAGPDPRTPLSLETPGEHFASSLERDLRGTRIAFDENLGGLPVDRRVAQVVASAIPVLEGLGASVQPSTMDWGGAYEAFQTLRAHTFADGLSSLPEQAMAQIKETVRWNVARGKALTAADIARAERQRTALHGRFADLMTHVEFLVLPVNQVPPFPIEEEFPTEIEGVPMETYIDWMNSASFVTLTGHPAISVPCGFTEEGLPVGLQIVGRQHEDFAVLQLAYAFQQATQHWKRRPPEPPKTPTN